MGRFRWWSDERGTEHDRNLKITEPRQSSFDVADGDSVDKHFAVAAVVFPSISSSCIHAFFIAKIQSIDYRNSLAPP